jgi:glycosyltransferase involved in cell wall biosynthesis
MKYSIGIVTYHARFESYFIPLIKRLAGIFPDIEIICVVNGHPDRTLQINYLHRAVDFMKSFPNIKYLTYDENQSLSKCWNQLVILSNTDGILILNDDTQVTDLFRQEMESKLNGLNFSVINNSWSHFFISKNIVKNVGWFDERLIGVGFEDIDYALRMGSSSIEVTNTECLGINNYVANQDNPGWQKVSDKMNSNKYSQSNMEFFKEKWDTLETNPEKRPEEFERKTKWHDSVYYFSPKNHHPTPIFYNLDCLKDNLQNESKVKKIRKNNVKIFFQKVYYFFKSLLKKMYRLVVS